MTTDTEDLRALDAEMARALGWAWWFVGTHYQLFPPDFDHDPWRKGKSPPTSFHHAGSLPHKPVPEGWPPREAFPKYVSYGAVPSYSTDWNLCMNVIRPALVERDVWDKFVLKAGGSEFDWCLESDCALFVGWLEDATPADFVRAALAVMREASDD